MYFAAYGARILPDSGDYAPMLGRVCLERAGIERFWPKENLKKKSPVGRAFLLFAPARRDLDCLQLLVENRPVTIGFGDEVVRILRERGIDIAIEIKVKLAVHDLPAIYRIHIEQFSDRHAP